MLELETLTRNRYFYGKLLSTENLELEQQYFNRKRWLLNRLALGMGVLRGLDVVATTDGTRVRVSAGVAIDGRGREIIAPSESQPVDPRALTDDRGMATGARVDGAGTVTLWLAYHECDTAPERMLVADCEAPTRCTWGAIAERYAVLIRQGAAPAAPGAVFDLSTLGQPGADMARVVATAVTKAPLDPPADPAVLLAEIALPAGGGAPSIDISRRTVAYSNLLLQELLLALTHP